MIGKYHITADSRILEIGCGEGRDSGLILEKGFPLTAADISREAIDYCKRIMPEHKDSFSVMDCLSNDMTQCFDFIFSVAVVHMLVLDEDRNGFYQFIRGHLAPGAIALICSMGNGEYEMRSDVSQAFTLQERQLSG